MKKTSVRLATAFLAGALLSLVLSIPVMSNSGETGPERRLPRGVYMELTKDFYEALKEGDSGAKIYTNDPSHEYLKQIAVSTRFMVRTNLEILKQQEKTIELLNSILKEVDK